LSILAGQNSDLSPKSPKNKDFPHFFRFRSLYNLCFFAYEIIMNKGELIDAVANALGEGASKKDAETALNAVLDSIANGVRNDGAVQIIGYGTFKKKSRAARMGRNPKTGESMQIAASTSMGFSPSAALKKTL
jgi:DNA-binding protein HU-beta